MIIPGGEEEPASSGDKRVGEVAELGGATSPIQPSVGRQSLGILGAQLITLVLGLAGSIILARTLGPSDRGALTVSGLAAAFAFGCLAVGGGISNVYFVGKGEVRPEVAAGTSWALTGLTSIIGLPVFFVVVYSLRTSLFRGIDGSVLILAGASISVFLIYRYLATIAQGLRAVALMTTSMIAASAVTLSLYLVLLQFLHLGVFAALLAGVLGTCVSVGILTFGSRWGRPSVWNFDRGYLVAALKFGIRGEIGNLLTTINYRFDVFFVTFYSGLAAAGLYTIAYTAVELLWQVPNALATILFPRVAADQGPGSALATAEIVRILLPLTIAAGIIGCSLAPFLVPFIFGRSYEGAVSALIALTPGVAIFGVGKLISAYLTGQGHPGICSTAAGVTAVITVLGDVTLIPHLGIVGAGIASTIGYTTNVVILSLAFRAVSKESLRTLLVVNRKDLQLVRAVLVSKRSRSGQSPSMAPPTATER